MAKFSWRSLFLSTFAASSFLTGTAQTSVACCLFGGWGDCCGGGSGGFYRGYSGYYSGYAPSYGYYAPAYNYGPAYGYGDTYASAGFGCSSCSGGGCGISTPATNPTKPEPDNGPDDLYRRTPDNRLKDTPPAETPRRSRAGVRETNPVDTLPKPPRSGGSSLDQGLRGRGTADDTAPAGTGADEEQPLEDFRTPRRGSGTGGDRFDGAANKPPMPDAADEQPEKDAEKNPASNIDNDNFDETEEEKSTGVEVKRPDLGASSDTDAAPADADAASNESHPQGDVIKPRPAPIDVPDPEEAVPDPQEPEGLKLDGRSVSAGVSLKTRLVLRGRFGTPSIVRLKVRPNRDWQPTANPPVLAKH